MEQYKYIKFNLKTRIDVLINENTIDVISYNTS